MLKTPNSALLALRQEIDEIDNELILLLEKRMQVIAKVGELKKSNQEKFFIRSAREADMIKNLIARAKNFPPEIICEIWRKIIVSANMHEQPLHIALHNPKNRADYFYILREYYSDLVPISNFDSVSNVVAEIQKEQMQIGVFALPQNEEDEVENWWINLANNRVGLKVFAKIPFLQKSSSNHAQLVCLAIKEPEKSSSDNSLLYVELASEFSKQQLLSMLKEIGLNGKILKSAKLPQVDSLVFYLLDIEGFLLAEDEVLKALAKSEIRPYIKVLGHYPTTLQI